MYLVLDDVNGTFKPGNQVLATFLETLIVFHNETYSTTLKIEDFHSYHFCDVWGGTNEEGTLLLTR